MFFRRIFRRHRQAHGALPLIIANCPASVQFQYETIADLPASMHLYHDVIAVGSLLRQKAGRTSSIKGSLVYAWIARKFDKAVNIARKTAHEGGSPGQANQCNLSLWKLTPNGTKGRNCN